MTRSPVDRRRSPRLTLEIPVLVSWRDLKGEGRAAKTHTAIVSRHGALLYLPQPLDLGHELRIVNRDSGQAASARVVWTGDVLPNGIARVGVELASPVGYDFWGTVAVRLWEEQQEAAPQRGWLARAWAWLCGAAR